MLKVYWYWPCVEDYHRLNIYLGVDKSMELHTTVPGYNRFLMASYINLFTNINHYQHCILFDTFLLLLL